MTTATPAATAEDIRQHLAEGKTVQEVADLTDWPHPRIIAVINGWPGYLYDRASDKAVRPGRPPQSAALAPAPAQVPTPAAVPARHPAKEPTGPSEESTRALLALIRSIRREMDGYGDPAVSRELERARAALDRLEEALTTGQERREAEAAVARARQELAAAEARLKAAKSGRPKPTPAAAAEPTTKEIRAWCADNDIECPSYGRIPASVRARYDAAHPRA